MKKRREFSVAAKMAAFFLALSLLALLGFAIDQRLLPRGVTEQVLVLDAEECRDFAGRYYFIRGTDPET